MALTRTQFLFAITAAQAAAADPPKMHFFERQDFTVGDFQAAGGANGVWNTLARPAHGPRLLQALGAGDRVRNRQAEQQAGAFQTITLELRKLK
jgi:hypothetical protein